MSLRRVRSPDAPKITITPGCGVRSSRNPSRNGFAAISASIDDRSPLPDPLSSVMEDRATVKSGDRRGASWLLRLAGMSRQPAPIDPVVALQELLVNEVTA